MKIAVCVNHVPDTEAKIKVAADNVSIDRTGVNHMLSPYDEIAVEEALRLREKFTGEVTAMSLGGESHKETLRKALVRPSATGSRAPGGRSDSCRPSVISSAGAAIDCG